MAKKQSSAVELVNAIDSHLKKVHTQSLDLSFNELLDMYMNKELDISPDYQRLFRWSEGARSRLIESLLLEMPVPPIYVIEEDDGKYLLIDGLQRISSYLHLRGELNAPHLEPPVQKGDMLKLSDCDIVKELNGKTFNELGTALQIRLKRAFVRVEVVRKGSNPQFKYHMFKRLNTGGQLLTDQQLRNCTIRLLDNKFNDFIIKASKNHLFQKCCTDLLTKERVLGAFDQELILRFFALKNHRAKFKHDVSDFLTEYMEGVSSTTNDEGISFDFIKEEKIFNDTFSVFAKTLGTYSFTFAQNKKMTKGFSVYHFEAFSLGIQTRLNHLDSKNLALMKALKAKFEEIKYDQQFITLTTGGGKNSSGQLKSRIKFVEDKIKDIT